MVSPVSKEQKITKTKKMNTIQEKKYLERHK